MGTNYLSGSRDRFTASVMYDIRKKMTTRIGTLRKEQEELTEKLKTGFDNDIYRQLSIVNQHIEVAMVRKKGEWLFGNHLQYTEKAK